MALSQSTTTASSSNYFFKKLKNFVSLVDRVRSKPMKVVVSKAAQFANLLLHHTLGVWGTYEKRALRRWNAERVERFVSDRKDDTTQLIGREGVVAARRFLQTEPTALEQLQQFREDVLARRVLIFDQPVDLESWDKIDWSADWRYGHRWPDSFYRCYNFYEFDKTVPYDVKFPWELSRLNFLAIPTLLECVEDSGTWPGVLVEVLTSWKKANPPAHSVNWYPMECAMRSINLTITTHLLVQAEQNEQVTTALSHLLQLCELHGRFVYRTIEYSDVRGNHFAAEVVALILLGLLLEGELTEAKTWFRYGVRHLEREILLQYSEDGVQFEKSTSYHRLVTELFLLAVLACDKRGRPIDDTAKTRLQNACRYVAAYTREDGSAPIWGDSDDARVLWLDTRPHWNHGTLMELAAECFDDAVLDRDGETSVAVPLFLGEQSKRIPSPAIPTRTQYFSDGGMVCFRSGGHHFMADVGSVGLNGKGGHGHLDSLSFELTLDGIPLIVDPGSFIYTGDPAQRNRFRSTRAHNVVMIDGMEMAELFPQQLWRLGNEADPYDIHWRESEVGFDLEASHNGYRRLEKPVEYRRAWSFSNAPPGLLITDWVDCNTEHTVERFFHFDSDLRIEWTDRHLIIHSGDSAQFSVTWEAKTDASLVDDWVSRSYGRRDPAKTLVLRDKVPGPCCLIVSITQVHPSPKTNPLKYR